MCLRVFVCTHFFLFVSLLVSLLVYGYRTKCHDVSREWEGILLLFVYCVDAVFSDTRHQKVPFYS